MTNIDQDFPGLEYLIDKFQMFESKTVFQNVIRRKFNVCIHLTDILV